MLNSVRRDQSLILENRVITEIDRLERSTDLRIKLESLRVILRL
jgi:hypothetical protein